MKYISLFAASVAALALCSCANEEYEGQSSGEQVRKVNFTVADFQWEDGDDAGRGAMKTQAVKSGSSIGFVWSERDTVGIYPNSGYQVAFPIESGTGSGNATFNGGGWALKANSTYTAYYPFDKYNFDKSHITLRYGVQEQVGNDNVDNLAKYDYIVSSMATPADGELTFQFQHLGCLVRFQFTMPEADNLTQFTLTSTEDVFPIVQNLNLSAGEPVVTTTQHSKTFRMNLSNVSVAAGENVVLYALMPSVSLVGKTLTATLRGASTYTATVIGKSYQSGKAVSYSATMNKQASDSHEYVDLGLSVKWATCNVGATTPEGYGDYFAWGATEPKAKYSWSTYKYCNGSSGTMKKYCQNSSYGYGGYTDTKTVLDPEDDAATVNWGSGWRMPTYTELGELNNNCYIVWTTSYNDTGVKGFIVYRALNSSDRGTKVYRDNIAKSEYTSSVDHIFLPAAGLRDDNSLWNVESGYYWSSSLDTSYPYNAYYLYFNSSDFYRSGYYRYFGRSVRPVCQ